jgi:hypothetical protein
MISGEWRPREKENEVRWTLQERCIGAEKSEEMFVQLNAR